jgi:hypothetical protein
MTAEPGLSEHSSFDIVKSGTITVYKNTHYTQYTDLIFPEQLGRNLDIGATVSRTLV